MNAKTPADSSPSTTGEKSSRPLKRPRYKCNGLHPCSNCRDFRAECVYLPPKSLNLQREQQKAAETAQTVQAVQAVEERVAELESLLRQEGIGSKRRERALQDTSGNTTPFADAPRPKKPKTSTPAVSSPAVMGPPGSVGGTMSTVVKILRDLSIQASGGFIGATSQITMGRVISSIVQAKEDTVTVTSQSGWENLSPKSANSGPPPAESSIELSQVPPEIAEKLFTSYIRYISTRWPIIQTPFLRILHTERDTITDVFFTSVLHLVYAIGGRFLETTGETGDFYPESHFDQALKNLDEILKLHDIRTVQVLLLLAIYSLRAPRGPGAWTYTGLAMRQCIEMGMHRKTSRKRSILEHEMRKRVFWTCYCLDRQVSIILGRPFAISDRDIDMELPLDIDEAFDEVTTNPQVIAEAQAAASAVPPEPAKRSTSMTGFIYICRLRIIESNIQQSVYRVDESSPATEAEVERFIQELVDWKALMPIDARLEDPDAVFVDGYDNYMVYYYKCMRFLLHPVVLSSSDTKYLQKCAEACGGVCRTYKRLHQSVPVGFSVMALHSVFLAGLTLLYCAWGSPKEVFNITTSNDMNACSIVLYIITERWPGARKYRDAYESIKQMVLESIEDSEYEPRRVITNLRPGLQATLMTIDQDEAGQGEFSAMVSNMAGGLGAGGDSADGSGSGEGTMTPGLAFAFTPTLDGMPLDFHDDAFNVDLQMGSNFQNMGGSEWMVA